MSHVKAAAVRRYLSEATWVALAYGVVGVSQWLLVVGITRLFGLSVMGTYSAAVAVVLPTITLLGFDSRGIQLADVAEKHGLADIFRVRMAGVCGAALVAIVLLWPSALEASTIGFTAALLAGRVGQALSEPAQTHLMKIRRYSTFGTAMVVRSLLSVIMFILFALVTRNAAVAMAASSLVWIAALVFVDLPAVALPELLRTHPFDVRKARDFATASLPLSYIGFINTLYVSIPILIVASRLGASHTGAYAASNYVAISVGLLVSTVLIVFEAPMAKMFSQQRRDFFRVLCGQLTFVALICSGVIAATALGGEVVLTLIYGEDMVAFGDVLLLQIVGMSFSFTARVLGTALTSIGANMDQAAIGTICIAAVVAACLVLIPLHGLQGAAAATLIGFLLKNALLSAVLLHHSRRKVV